MSDHTSPNPFESPLGADDGIGVRFPPGLGLIPPRELARVPRPRSGGELAA
jgi:hypothetical protein